MSRQHRETGRVLWPRNATERAIRLVILRWHIAGCLKQLRGGA